MSGAYLLDLNNWKYVAVVSFLKKYIMLLLAHFSKTYKIKVKYSVDSSNTDECESGSVL